MYSGVKRIFDIVLSFLVLILLSPLFLAIGIAIKLDSPGPVFFSQRRTGKNGRIFRIYKFRTMAKNNDIYDTTRQDNRTRVGRILRKFSLDELPQFWNVLKGEMSIVGPRPWISDYLLYMAPSERRRLRVRPGITGLAQVNGRNNLNVHQKIRYDLEYIEHLGPIEDLRVVFRTIFCLILPENTELDGVDSAGARFGDGGKAHIYSELDELKNASTLALKGDNFVVSAIAQEA